MVKGSGRKVFIAEIGPSYLKNRGKFYQGVKVFKVITLLRLTLFDLSAYSILPTALAEPTKKIVLYVFWRNTLTENLRGSGAKGER